jgi:hypothetical protein
MLRNVATVDNPSGKTCNKAGATQFLSSAPLSLYEINSFAMTVNRDKSSLPVA